VNRHNLAPALVFALIDTVLMFGIGIEIGRRQGTSPRSLATGAEQPA